MKTFILYGEENNSYPFSTKISEELFNCIKNLEIQPIFLHPHTMEIILPYKTAKLLSEVKNKDRIEWIKILNSNPLS